MSEEKKVNGKNEEKEPLPTIHIQYGSDANGDPIGPEEAESLEKLLNKPEIQKLIFSETPEEYGKRLDKEVDEDMRKLAAKSKAKKDVEKQD